MVAQLLQALVFQLSPEVVQWMDGVAKIGNLAEVKKKNQGERCWLWEHGANEFIWGCWYTWIVTALVAIVHVPFYMQMRDAELGIHLMMNAQV